MLSRASCWASQVLLRIGDVAAEEFVADGEDLGAHGMVPPHEKTRPGYGAGLVRPEGLEPPAF